MIVEKISSRQLTWLTFTIAISTSSLFLPGMVIFHARQNAWVSIILAAASATAGTMLNVALAQRFPGQSIAQYAQILLGPWLGKAIGLVYALAFLYLDVACLNFIAQLIQIALMPDTPLLAFLTGLGLLAVYSAWLGIEPIARANEIVLPPNVLMAGLILLLALPQAKLYRGLPVTQFNWAAIAQGMFPPAACLGEVFFVLMLAPALNKPGELKAATLKGLLFAGLFFLVITQSFLFILGAFRAAVYLFPALRIFEEILILDIFEKFEPIVLIMWMLLITIKADAFTYLYALAAAHTFNRPTHTGFLLPALPAIPLLALVPQNLAEVWQFWLGTLTFRYVIPLVFLVLPALLFLIAKVKKANA